VNEQKKWSEDLSPCCRHCNVLKHYAIMQRFLEAAQPNYPPMMEPTFEKLLVRLARSKVRFILVGGIAVTLHGYVRLTEDVGVLIDNSTNNIWAFLDTMSDYGEGFARGLSLDDFDDEEGAIRIVETVEGSQIDVFTVVSGRKYMDLKDNAEVFDLRDYQILYASKQDLINLKNKSLREKDRLDVMALKRLQEDPRAFD